MTRISDLGFQQILLASFQRAQSAAETRQIQLSTGKVSDRYSGVGVGTQRLLSYEGIIERATAYEKAAGAAASRLETQEAALTTIADSVAKLRERFVIALSTGGAELIAPEIVAEAQRIIAALNTETGGVYVFGGVDGTVPPTTAGSLADIAAAADTDTLFIDAARQRLAVEEGTSVDGGATAREVASSLYATLKELANAPAALGAFSGSLTNAQSAFLSQKIAELDQISAELYEELGLNGLAQGQTEDARIRNGQRRDLAEIVASEIEDADLAEVVARLNQDRLAIEAAAQALSQASELSLLNFL
ncbi:MAG: flagellin [Pseudomonadota bacterium]